MHLVDEDEAQIARLQAVEGVVDGGEFAVDFFHVAGAFGALQALAQQGEDFAVGAAALAGVLVEDDVVEGCAEDAGLLADVFIAPVARAADDDAAAARGHVADAADQGVDGVGVVPVVGDDGGAGVVEDVEAAGHGALVAGEGGQAAPDGVPGQAQAPGCADGGQRVFHLKADEALVGDGHAREGQAFFKAAFGADDVAVLHIDHALALREVGFDDGVLAVLREEDDAAGAAGGHGDDVGVGGVEHGAAGGGDVEHDDALEHHQVFERGDVVQAQVVARAEVGDDGNVAFVKGQSFAQQAAARGFEHGGVHVGVGEHVAGAARAGAVAGVDLAAVGIDAVGVGHAHAQAVGGQQVGRQAHGGGFAVGAGDGHERDAAIGAVAAAGEHVLDDGFAHVAPFAEGGADVHAQAGGGIDFDDAAALLFQRAQHAFADDVHAADVQPHGERGFNGAGGHVGVHVVGDVGGGAAGGEVGVVAQDDALAPGRHAFGREVLPLEAGGGDGVDADLRERGAVAFAPARVFVHFGHQFAHGVLAVADDQRRLAAGGGHELVAHHEQAVVVAGEVFFDHDVAVLGRFLPGQLKVGAAADADGDAFALVAALRLDDDGQAHFLRHGPAVFQIGGGAAQGHGHAGGVQHFFGQVLVLRDGFGDGAGAVFFSGLDAPLPRAPAQLHKAAAREPPAGNAALEGRFDDGAGGRPQAFVFVQIAQLGQRGGDVKGFARVGGAAQLLRAGEGQAPHGFFGVLHHHLEHARLFGWRGAAEGDLAARLRLQRQGGLLQHVRHGYGLAGAGHVQRAHAGKALAQAFFKRLVQAAFGFVA